MLYNKIYKSKSGDQYKLWSQKDSYGNKKFGWNRYKLNNWYNDTGDGFFTAKERDREFKQVLKQ
jgi:hypothetical protein